MKIFFLINKDLNPNTYAFIYPIILNKNNLKKYKINIGQELPETSYDLIFVDSKFFAKEFADNNFEKTKNNLIFLKNKSKILVYCDNEASIFINKNIFNYIDYYFKGKLPKNLNIYKKSLYGQREFTDYYNKYHNIKDKNENFSKILDDNQISKIYLGWNNGISDYSYFSILKKNIYKYTNIFIRNKKINTIKKNKISARFKQNYSRNTINYHRQLYEKLFSKNFETSRVNRFKYFQELKNSYYSFSPFGWGEICYRDFESFLYECILIKPDMEHILTWPNYYIKNKTYISVPWYLKDIDEFMKIFENEKIHAEIGINGNKNYFQYFDTEEKKLFSKHFENLLNKITNT